MKLYATVTSERASKGQGGEYLDIEILEENKEVIAQIKVRNYRFGHSITLWHGNKTDVRTFKDVAMNKKGEKQKGETRKCEDGKHYHADGEEYPDCYMSM